MSQTTISKSLEKVAGKYLTFELDNEEYGIQILQVREIIGMMDITTVPQMPDYIKGVLNLRGKVVPVIDIRLKFVMQALDYTEETCIIVLNVGTMEMGIIVDRVCEVHDIAAEAIEPSPDFGTNLKTDFIIGMGKINDNVTMLLDIEKILRADVAVVEAAKK